MLVVAWKGSAPPPAVARALSSAGFEVSTRARTDASVHVVATRDGRAAPRAPAGDQPWIWVSSGPIERAAGREAAARSAYDGVALGTPDAVERLVRRVRELTVLDAPPEPSPTFIAQSAAARRVLAQLARAARTSMPVLITGETGTGKEVAARLVHAWSSRRTKPFVPINCAAVPNELMEAELFGYAKGAFSGAVRAYDGRIMAAEGGTVFLDEIDDTPSAVQVKLLRVLEDRVVSRLGENDWHEVDFRLVAATNRDLAPLIASGAFGADLFERLAIVSVLLPPLRERIEDLPALATHFIARFYREEPDALKRCEVIGVTPEALEALGAYRWPGNIRELRNVIFEALVDKRAGTELLLSDLPRRILMTEARVPSAGLVDPSAVAREMDRGRFNLREELDRLRRIALKLALERAGGNAAAAAKLLGEVGRGHSSDPGGTVRAMMRRLRVR